jgi:hypothetical protein
MGFAAAATVLHGLFARPNRPTAEDEANAERLVNGEPGGRS